MKQKMKFEGLVADYKLKPDELVDAVTPTSDLFVLAHLGVPDISLDTWSLTLDGLVERPMKFDFASITKFPKRTLLAVHKCSGSPLKPTVPTRQVANVEWAGIDLHDFLSAAGAAPNATYLWAYGLDNGEFAGHEQDSYLKDIPLSRVREEGALLAYELNGQPLPLEHGFPLRLVVPGFYGTNNVKWLHKLHVATERARSAFTTTYYNDPLPGKDATKPVWEIEPECQFVYPDADADVPVGDVEVWGWCWSNCEVVGVEVSSDDGFSWQDALVEPRRQWSWQRFSHTLHIDIPGEVNLVCRATDAKGRTQPLSGARNEIYSISFVAA